MFPRSGRSTVRGSGHCLAKARCGVGLRSGFPLNLCNQLIQQVNKLTSTDCKAVYIGSIPFPASNILYFQSIREKSFPSFVLVPGTSDRGSYARRSAPAARRGPGTTSRVLVSPRTYNVITCSTCRRGPPSIVGSGAVARAGRRGRGAADRAQGGRRGRVRPASLGGCPLCEAEKCFQQ